jgi:hypothetical protein
MELKPAEYSVFTQYGVLGTEIMSSAEERRMKEEYLAGNLQVSSYSILR